MGKHVLNVLVVEDHADTRNMLGMFLRHLGHCCYLAPDAQSALERAVDNPFDVLLTDVHMPGMDGWGLVKALAAGGQLPRLVVSMSAGVSEEEEAQSKAAGCHAHLLKPFALGDLEAALAG